MGFFSSIGSFLRKAAAFVLPVLGAALGGPIGAAIGAAAGSVIGGGSFKEVLISTAIAGGTAAVFGADSASSVFGALQGTPISALVAGAVGTLASLTLGQALLLPDEEAVDDLLAQGGISPEKIAALRAEARDAQLEEVFTRITGAEGFEGAAPGESGGLTTAELQQFLDSRLAAQGTVGQSIVTNDSGDIITVPEAPGLAGEIENIRRHIEASQNTPESIEAIIGDTSIPEGLSTEEFDSIIRAGLQRRNEALGPDLTQGQFTAEFGGSGLGAELLGEETEARRGVFGESVASAFPGPGDAGAAFAPNLDDEIIAAILDERSVGAGEQIGRTVARGNLNPLGGKTANQALAAQRAPAEERLRDIGSGVLSLNIRDLGELRSGAEQSALSFNLGDDLFDVAPFEQERSDLIGARTSSLEGDLRTALGGERLFNPPEAIQAGGRSQGVVSGAPSGRLLDALAAREESRKRGTRGLGLAGSGAF